MCERLRDRACMRLLPFSRTSLKSSQGSLLAYAVSELTTISDPIPDPPFRAPAELLNWAHIDIFSTGDTLSAERNAHVILCFSTRTGNETPGSSPVLMSRG